MCKSLFDGDTRTGMAQHICCLQLQWKSWVNRFGSCKLCEPHPPTPCLLAEDGRIWAISASPACLGGWLQCNHCKRGVLGFGRAFSKASPPSTCSCWLSGSLGNAGVASVAFLVAVAAIFASVTQPQDFGMGMFGWSSVLHRGATGV